MRRFTGRPRKRWLENIQENMKEIGITIRRTRDSNSIIRQALVF